MSKDELRNYLNDLKGSENFHFHYIVEDGMISSKDSPPFDGFQVTIFASPATTRIHRGIKFGSNVGEEFIKKYILSCVQQLKQDLERP